MFFELTAPLAPPIPVVVEVPHAGLFVDPESLATLVAPARSLGRDADLHVDELFADAPQVGAVLLRARVSRYVCDLNRAETDVDSRTVEGCGAEPFPHGLIWRRTTEDQPALAQPLAASELERRLSRIYRPYHQALSAQLQAVRERFGFVILVCGHSMPSRGRTGHLDRGRARADLVPGSRGRTSAAGAVIDAVADLAHARGLSVAHDDPYRGGFSTGHYGKPHAGVHAIQVELNRKLYMDEQTLATKANDFESMKTLCRELVAELGRLELA